MTILKNKYWLAFLPWCISLLLSPPYNFRESFKVKNTKNDCQYYETVIEQINKIAHLDYVAESHESKMEVRILPPLFLRIFNPIDRKYIPIIIYLLNAIFLFLFFLEINNFQEKYAPELVRKNIFALNISTLYVGICYLMDFWPMFDGWAFLLIMLFINSRFNSLRLVYFSLALFVDERSVFPLISAIFFLNYQNDKWLWKMLKLFIFSMAIYVLFRMLLTFSYGLRSVFVMSDDVHIFNYIDWVEIHLLVVSLINVFKGMWIFFIFFIFYVFRLNKSLLFQFVFYSGVLLMVFCASVSVADFTRSMSYGFPVILFLVVLLYREKVKEIEWLSPIFWVNLITPITFFHSASAIYFHEDLLSKLAIIVFQHFK